MKELNGWHVFAMFATGFGLIIAVNLLLAFSAVRTFPGLEVKNSYVASQRFDAERAAQTALGWEASASLHGDRLVLSLTGDGNPVQAEIKRAVFGRATSVSADQTPVFRQQGGAYVAQVVAGPGNWNLRLEARAADGTLFRQRIIVEEARP